MVFAYNFWQSFIMILHSDSGRHKFMCKGEDNNGTACKLVMENLGTMIRMVSIYGESNAIKLNEESAGIRINGVRMYVA